MTKQSGIIHVVPKTESWKVPGVSYRGQTGNYEVVGEMTPSMTQDKLVEKYGVEIPSAPLIWAVSSRAYNLRAQNPDDAESLKNFLRQGFRRYPNTSTRVVYNPSGTDEVIHNYGTSNQYSLSANVTGSDGWMKDISDKGALESLLGTNNISRINKVANWVNGTDAYIWRVNSKPSKKDERAARFYANVDGLNLDCGRNPLDECPAFRVLRIE